MPDSPIIPMQSFSFISKFKSSNTLLFEFLYLKCTFSNFKKLKLLSLLMLFNESLKFSECFFKSSTTILIEGIEKLSLPCELTITAILGKILIAARKKIAKVGKTSIMNRYVHD